MSMLIELRAGALCALCNCKQETFTPCRLQIVIEDGSCGTLAVQYSRAVVSSFSTTPYRAVRTRYCTVGRFPFRGDTDIRLDPHGSP